MANRLLRLERRSVAVAYGLWALGLVGVCGLHRFYNRKPLSGTLWLLTFGLCGLGQLVDLFLLPGLINQANQPLLLEQALAQLDGRGSEGSARLPIDRQLLALARRSGPAGFTLNDAVLELAGRDPAGEGSGGGGAASPRPPVGCGQRRARPGCLSRTLRVRPDRQPG